MPEGTKKKSKKKLLYAGGALAGLAALGALAAWLLGRKKAGPPPVDYENEVAREFYGLPSDVDIADIQRAAEEAGLFRDRGVPVSDEELVTITGLDPDKAREILNLPKEPTSNEPDVDAALTQISALLGGSAAEAARPYLPQILGILKPEKVPIPPKPKE